MVTEIGVSGIYPIITERAIVKVDGEKIGRKLDRWRKIATEAAKQSHRTTIPKVNPVIAWREALQELRSFDQIILFWEEETETLPYEVLDPAAGKIAVVIGPEGGLSEKEAGDLKNIGARVATLGESILRVETAAPVAVALAIYDLRRIKNKKEIP
jgi:16S rRNA (uracil1498-N3)-methyltransferase